MSSIVVFGRDQEIAYYYSFLLEGNFDCEVESYDSLSEFKMDELTSKKNLSVIVISTELDNADRFIKTILASKSKIPMILTHTKVHERAAKIKYKFNALYELFEDGSEPKGFVSIAEKALKRKEVMNKGAPQYCRVKAEYFMHSKKTVCDIFLKLSSEKFIKIFNRFHEFSNGDIENFITKKTEYFYIHERDYKGFVALMSKALEKEVLHNSEDSNNEQANAMTAMNCQEMVQETIDKLGINESAISITNVAITSTLKFIQKGDVESMFNKVYHTGDFLAEHSLVVTYLASAICRETEWHTRENILRICLAGFFHDITLTDEKLVKVCKEDSFEFNDLSRREQSTVLGHTKKSVELINKINGIPIGVDTIIDFHHERYDGSGFPRHVDYKRFSPLAAIFVIAHEITEYLFEAGFDQDNMNDIVFDMEDLYTKGCFKKIIPVLRKVLGVQAQIEAAG